MKAIILAAGQGTRLMPYTSDTPKCMVKVSGKSLIHYQIDVLNKLGVHDITIVKGYHAEKIKINGTKTVINKKFLTTNMVYSLFCAESELEGEVIIAYGDIVYSASVLNKLINSNHNISVAVDLDWKKYWKERFVNPLDDAESLELDSKGRIISIGKSTQNYDKINGQYIGLLKLTSQGLEIIKNYYKKFKKINQIQNKSIENSFMTDFLQSLIDEGVNIWPVNIHGEWVEVDTVKDIELAVTKKRLNFISKLNLAKGQ